MRRAGGVGWCALLGALALGCAQAEKPPSLGPDDMPGPDADGAAAGADGGDEGTGGAGGLAADAGAVDCATPQPGASPILRLNRFQLHNTLQVLFEDVPDVFAAVEPVLFGLPSEPPERSYPPSALLVDVYYEVARAAAAALSHDRATLVTFCGCDPEDTGAEACRDQMIERFVLRAYRRPPNDEDLSELRAVFENGQVDGDFASGVQAVVEVVLQGPDFLYLIELGTDDVQGEAVALSPYETSTRVSYFLTAQPPDQELLTAAAAGPLSAAVIEEQARRLIGTAANRSVTRHFMEELLDLQRSLARVIDPAQHPSYTPQIGALALEETGRFVEDVTFEGAGTFQALFSEPTTWLNEPLAQFYGVADVSGDQFQRVELDASKRAGILTQAAFLGASSPSSRTSPVQRGIAVLTSVLCFVPPPPPLDVPVLPPPELPPQATTRERLLEATAPPDCQVCHRAVDPVGLAFENYDAVGLWRDTENGLPIDASGSLLVTDAEGPFLNAVELIQHIAASHDARSCFAGHWLAYAYGRPSAPEDTCARQQIEASFETSDGNIIELLVAVAKSDNLRYRLQSELLP